MDNRLTLHSLLCKILECPETGPECRAYFQPPESIKIKYPAIVYSLNNIENLFANDRVYLSGKQWMLILIDSNPDSPLIEKIGILPTCRFIRHYTSDNLNHDVFNIFH